MTIKTITLTPDEVHALAFSALLACGTSRPNAESVARSVTASEVDGIHSHGLARLPTYCEHARCGKIKGRARPTVKKTAAAAVTVNANDGFAHPAIDKGFDALVPLAQRGGVAAMSVYNSYNCGVLGYHVEALAQRGLLGLGFTNAPASMAPHGGRAAVFGTNPVALAAPDGHGRALLIVDQSSSVVAKSELVVHAAAGKRIPKGWALDAAGKPTTDPEEGLKGTMLPSGDYKGAGIALMVEVMAAAMAGASLAIDASSFADNRGPSPRTGQFFIAVNPRHFGAKRYDENMRRLAGAINAQPGARLPGAGRFASRKRIAAGGITFPLLLHQRILNIIQPEED
ncbi:MAG: Ldh family oxidoreductase [Gammaproteobacteria bacterium]|nr:Ldh family oxidoreductase [Gammaproteobacteria bacterium]